MAMFCVYSHSTRVYLELLTLFRADEEVGLYMIAISSFTRLRFYEITILRDYDSIKNIGSKSV